MSSRRILGKFGNGIVGGWLGIQTSIYTSIWWQQAKQKLKQSEIVTNLITCITLDNWIKFFNFPSTIPKLFLKF